MSHEDVEELVDEHSEELIEKLLDIHLQVQQTKELVEETGKNMHSSEIKDNFSK